MATYRLVPIRDLKAAPDHAIEFEADDDTAARLEGFRLFVNLSREFQSAYLDDRQGRRIDTWGRSDA